MSLRDELDARKITVAELATLIDETYGATMTALVVDADGRETKRKAVLARQAKIREFLDSETAAADRVAAQVQANQDPQLSKRQARRPAPEGLVSHVDPVRLADGTEICCGTVLVLPGADGARQCRYTVLRVIAAPEGDVRWVDVYGGPVFTKQLNTGPDREFRHRSLRADDLGLPSRLDLEATA